MNGPRREILLTCLGIQLDICLQTQSLVIVNANVLLQDLENCYERRSGFDYLGNGHIPTWRQRFIHKSESSFRCVTYFVC